MGVRGIYLLWVAFLFFQNKTPTAVSFKTVGRSIFPFLVKMVPPHTGLYLHKLSLVAKMCCCEMKFSSNVIETYNVIYRDFQQCAVAK